jgi:hypothetical protein
MKLMDEYAGVANSAPQQGALMMFVPETRVME